MTDSTPMTLLSAWKAGRDAAAKRIDEMEKDEHFEALAAKTEGNTEKSLFYDRYAQAFGFAAKEIRSLQPPAEVLNTPTRMFTDEECAALLQQPENDEGSAQAARPTEEGWRDIASCPRNGTSFIAKRFSPEWTSPIIQVGWDVAFSKAFDAAGDKGLHANHFRGWPAGSLPPTHWYPDDWLPPPPPAKDSET